MKTTNGRRQRTPQQTSSTFPAEEPRGGARVIALSPLPPDPSPGSVPGRVEGWSADGLPLVSSSSRPGGPWPARLVGELSRSSLEYARESQRDVLILFGPGDPPAAYVLGVVQPLPSETGVPCSSAVVERDGDRLVIQGEREVVLRCGESQVVLRRDGKILISGTNIVTRARRRHRIKGGVVLIN